MLLKLKKNEGAIKGQECVDIRRKRNWLPKEDTTYTTVSTGCLMLAYMTDAMEGGNFVTEDIPGAFLQTD